PPGWVPPGQTAAPLVASIAPPQPVVAPAPQAEPETPDPISQAQTATIDFARQSVELSDAMKGELGRVAKTFAGRIEVRSYFGGTDSDGRKISLARALIVRKYLIDQGVKSTAIEVGTFAAGAGARGDRVDIVGAPIPQPALASTTVAANPNRAFEPPPGWVPPGQMAAAAPAPRPLPPATPAPQAEPATPAPANQALLGTIGFTGQSIELTDAMKAALDGVAKRFAGRSPRQIEVRSYSGGTDPYSRQVSLARALIVRSYLIDRGLKARAIEVATFSADGAGADGERVDILAIGS
ncbi:MAG: OmpA family protein, partial [Reyranella sp.]|nr:OmpA family protein [Reyranella sp.]